MEILGHGHARAQHVATYLARYSTKASADLDRRILPSHVHRMAATAWALGGDPELEHLGLRRHAHRLGYRWHFDSSQNGRTTRPPGAEPRNRDLWLRSRMASVPAIPPAVPIDVPNIGVGDRATSAAETPGRMPDARGTCHCLLHDAQSPARCRNQVTSYELDSSRGHLEYDDNSRGHLDNGTFSAHGYRFMSWRNQYADPSNENRARVHRRYLFCHRHHLVGLESKRGGRYRNFFPKRVPADLCFLNRLLHRAGFPLRPRRGGRSVPRGHRDRVGFEGTIVRLSPWDWMGLFVIRNDLPIAAGSEGLFGRPDPHQAQSRHVQRGAIRSH